MAEIDYDRVVALDRSRHFATVFPPEDGAHFFQDGFYFTHHGKLAPAKLDDDAKKRIAKLQNRKEAQAAMQKAKEKFKAEHGLTDDDLDDPDAVTTVIAAATGVADGEVDVIAWAKGQKDYRFFRIRDAVLKQYNFQGVDKRSIIDFLIKENLVPESEVR